MIYEICIRNARVIDPETGLDAVCNIGIAERKIAALETKQLCAFQYIEGGGLVAAPGFIDIHAHEDSHLGAAPLPVVTSACALRTGNTTITPETAACPPSPPGSITVRFARTGFPRTATRSSAT
jgi:predicted amidohydrolase